MLKETITLAFNLSFHYVFKKIKTKSFLIPLLSGRFRPPVFCWYRMTVRPQYVLKNGQKRLLSYALVQRNITQYCLIINFCRFLALKYKSDEQLLFLDSEWFRTWGLLHLDLSLKCYANKHVDVKKHWFLRW